MTNSLLKIMSLAILALAASSSLYADEGGQIKTYSNEALHLANVVKHCSLEVAELSKIGPANKIVSATHEMMSDLDIYTLQFEAGGMAPSFKRYPVGALKIGVSFQRSFNNAPDAPGGHYVYNCEIVKPTK